MNLTSYLCHCPATFSKLGLCPRNRDLKPRILSRKPGVRETKAEESMGEFCNEELNFASSQGVRFFKHVHDNVHGNIYLDPLVLKFIDTEQFQRLRDLKQLGLAHMVYPGAVHSRFEHSLGVYWLAGEAVHKLKTHQGLELGIDRFDVQTVKLAGILHDIGHGPFSHLFEHEFLPKVLNGSQWSHEQMSVDMVDHIVEEHHIEIETEMVKRVKEMILASSKFAMDKSAREKFFLYDIVANGRNGIDVDKFDYIVRDSRACGLGCNFQFQRLMETMRVMGDEICYRNKDYLFRTVYTHAKVKAIDLMVVDALVGAYDYLEISSYIHDPSKYWKLDDTIIKTIQTSPAQELKESRDLIQRIFRRDLYKFCDECIVPKDKLENFKHVTAQDIICSQKSGGVTLREEDVVVSNVKIDLTRGRNNPLESIMFFEDYQSEEKFPIPDSRVSHLLPTYYQDMIVRVYSKKPELVKVISEASKNFQLRTYGMKAQVH
ncbi:deoxynucleoside triphosphate triphosphohydrolase SAMHD1 homolog isoform X2 [Olea europaea var. sylvestris]|uniref:deoxynucleoside triphosphate triphosphohydrolase SAMHD1 homolog isoform X2 n=1 Tax=Olea europaea var. sylvestris TaxID=158386 RepID=UPI000C1D46A7|nr:deoxynucleoside triphosphate triphosphohydrolase SAMHD1 homolog isoform X2 [Olea europaea var. sylvestris]